MPEAGKPLTLREKIAALKRKVGEGTKNTESKEDMQRTKADNIKRHKREKMEMAKAAAAEENRLKEGWELVADKLKTVIEWSLLGIKVQREKLFEDINYTEWLVDVGSEGKFVARMLSNSKESKKLRNVLQLDQEREYAFQSAAGRYGVGLVSPHFIPPIVLHRYKAEVVNISSLESDTSFRELATFLRRFHGMEHTGLTRFFSLNAFIEIQDMISAIKKDSTLFEKVEGIKEISINKMTEVIDQFSEILGNHHADDLSKQYVCHNMLSVNCFKKFIQPGKPASLYLTNFQFASVGDRYYDLACCSYLSKFTDDSDTVFLRIYFEEEGPLKNRQIACFRLLKRVAMFRTALYSLLLGDYTDAETRLKEFQAVVDDSDFARYIGEELIS